MDCGEGGREEVFVSYEWATVAALRLVINRDRGDIGEVSWAFNMWPQEIF